MAPTAVSPKSTITPEQMEQILKEELPPLQPEISEKDKTMAFLFASCEAKTQMIQQLRMFTDRMQAANKVALAELKRLQEENNYLKVQIASMTQLPTTGLQPGLSETIIQETKPEKEESGNGKLEEGPVPPASPLAPIPISKGGTPIPVDGLPIAE